MNMTFVHQIICPTLQSILMDSYLFVYNIGACTTFDLMDKPHWYQLEGTDNFNKAGIPLYFSFQPIFEFRVRLCIDS